MKFSFCTVAMDLLTMKTAKGGRKISLPWFRQSSVQPPHAALSRQHTIDTGQLRSFFGSKKLQVVVLPLSIGHLMNVILFSARQENHHTKSIKKIIKFRRLNKFAFMSLFSACLCVGGVCGSRRVCCQVLSGRFNGG